MKLWLILVAAILAVPAAYFLARWARHEGRMAAYEMRLKTCAQKYPRYRCVVELARDFADVQR